MQCTGNTSAKNKREKFLHTKTVHCTLFLCVCVLCVQGTAVSITVLHYLGSMHVNWATFSEKGPILYLK